MKLLYKILCLGFFFGFSLGLSAQTINYDTLIPPLGNPQLNFDAFLVQLGWANAPSKSISQYQLKKTESKYKLAKLDWFKDISFAMNLNENNIVKQENNPVTPIFDPFPRWNIQATVNLGRIIDRPVKVDMARDDIFIAKSKFNAEKIKVRAEVLKKYFAYQHTLEILKIRKQFEEDANQNYVLMNKRFRQGTAQMDDFNRASSALVKAKEATLNAVGMVGNAKLDLEILIGTSLEKAKEMHENVINPD